MVRNVTENRQKCGPLFSKVKAVVCTVFYILIQHKAHKSASMEESGQYLPLSGLEFNHRVTFVLQVLATGLSGLYSSLPTKLEAPSDEWHCLQRDDWLRVPALVQFLNSLEFCNAVIQVKKTQTKTEIKCYKLSSLIANSSLHFSDSPPRYQRPVVGLHLQWLPRACTRARAA